MAQGAELAPDGVGRGVQVLRLGVRVGVGEVEVVNAVDRDHMEVHIGTSRPAIMSPTLAGSKACCSADPIVLATVVR